MTPSMEVAVDQRISLITLGVADLSRSVRFYRDGLGWTLSSSSIEGEIAFFQLQGCALGLWPRPNLAADANLPLDEGWGGLTLAHNLRSRAEVDALFAQAVAAGARPLKEPTATDWGGYSGYFADPDGHPWEVAHNPFWELAEDGRLTLPG